MDLLPLIPGRDGVLNAARPIREAFQDILDGKVYPKKVAEYIINCQVDDDLRIKENAEQVLQIYEALNDILENIDNAGHEIMEQQGLYMIKKEKLDDLQDIKERIRLQHCHLFKNLRIFYVDYFSLLQKNDLLPDFLKRSIDFRINEKLHLCKDCMKKVNTDDKLLATTDKYRRRSIERKYSRKAQNRERKKSTIKEKLKDLNIVYVKEADLRSSFQRKETGISPFAISPKFIEFQNCEPGVTYKRTVKLINTSGTTQSLVIKDFPQSKMISVEMDINSKLASGMSCFATVIYKPEYYVNIQDFVSFRNQLGYLKRLTVNVFRSPPKLITCIFKSNSCHLDRPRPGSARFLDARREALNTSIDCGSCLVGEFVYLSVFVQNKGMKGKFFIITEDEWYLENLETISKSLEYSSDSLWIYPTYFELATEEMTEINILFSPSQCEMYLEKFYIICDNNTTQQFEVIGDGLTFNNNMLKIDVPPYEREIEKKENYCIVFRKYPSKSSITLTLTVHNKSSLSLKGYWKFEKRRIKDINLMDESWIELVHSPPRLAPYSTTDFQFKINVNTTEEGYHNIYFIFCIADVPLMSLEKDTRYVVTNKKLGERVLAKSVDVNVVEFELACEVENPQAETLTTTESTIPSDSKIEVREPKVEFTCSFLEFGILPNGLSVQKPFWVRNLSWEPTKWKIVEVKYNIDSPPYMEVIKSDISCTSGEFFCVCTTQKIFYNVTKKGPLSWVSMLLLVSMDEDTLFEVESICIVTYEIINYNISINGNSDYPVLCPLKVMYTGVPHTLNVIVENHSPITGFFYFLKPFGKNTDAVDISIEPIHSILRPLESKMVEMKITGHDVGIFEDIYIPCLVNKYQECIVARLLCAVDTVHLAIYLPGRKDYYQKILWPPKIVFEYDENWMICPCTLEYSPEMEVSDVNDSDSSPKVGSSIEFRAGYNTPIVPRTRDNSASIETAKESNSASLSKSSSDTSFPGLREILTDQFGDELFLQDHLVEVHKVQVKTPTKVTFYMENITPMGSCYTVEATNFCTTKAFDELAHQFKLKKVEDIWNDMIMNEYGILVLPDVKEASISGFSLVEVNLTIFANTWGIYQEEIAVDVAEVPCFTFSLLIEAVGCPVVFPLALTRTSDPPVMRLGSVAYCSDEIQRRIRVVNTSSIPLKVMWHSFVKSSFVGDSDSNFNMIFDITSKDFLTNDVQLDITNRYYGTENTDLFTINPAEVNLEENSSDFIDVTMRTTQFSSKMDKTYVRCSILGSLFVREKHRKKLNYFFRRSDYVRMEVLATLDLPVLRADFVGGETTLRFYANQVVFDRGYKESTRLVFQNTHSCPAEVTIEVDEPLEVLDVEEGKYVVPPLCCREIAVVCNMDLQKILNLSEVVYPKKNTNVDKLTREMNVHLIDKELKVVHLKRDFRILHKAGTQQVVPLDVYIYFPYISAKPSLVRYDQVFLGNTLKTLVTVFNHTGYPVNFEIYKSLASEVLFITPHYGTIEGSKGANKSFVHIFIYFSPREPRQYQESIRIVTNLPNYYIEVPIRGTGTVNEKFLKHYKI